MVLQWRHAQARSSPILNSCSFIPRPSWSGAIQHRVGVEGADLIVAINTDKNAPILDIAHFAVATDAIRFLPALTEAFRARISPHAKDRLAG